MSLPDAPIPTLPPYPADAACLACGYSLTGIATATCPECGKPIDPATVTAAGCRARAVHDWESDTPHLLLAALFITIIYSIGTAVVLCEIYACGYSALVIACALAGTCVLGAIAALSNPAPDRRVIWIGWVRNAWILHTPWLCMPFCALCVFATAALIPPIINVVAVTGFFIWLFALLAAITLWVHRWYDRWCRALQLRGFRAVGIPFLLALINLACTALLGFVGGIIVIDGADRWFGIRI